MTHLPFIAASYVLGLGIPLSLGISAALRLRRVRRMLRATDPREANP